MILAQKIRKKNTVRPTPSAQTVLDNFKPLRCCYLMKKLETYHASISIKLK